MTIINKSVTVSPDVKHIVDYKEGTITFTENLQRERMVVTVSHGFTSDAKQRVHKGKRKISKWWIR